MDALQVDRDLERPIDAPDYEPVLTRFRRVAAANPERTAVVVDEESWTYADLAGAAAAVADQIRRVGLHPGDVVATTGNRSFALVASILGILGEGMVLLLLDPALPAGRWRRMIDVAGPRALVVAETGPPAGRIDVSDLPIIHVDGRGRLPDRDAPDLARDRAYIFFTSGIARKPSHFGSKLQPGRVGSGPERASIGAGSMWARAYVPTLPTNWSAPSAASRPTSRPTAGARS